MKSSSAVAAVLLAVSSAACSSGRYESRQASAPAPAPAAGSPASGRETAMSMPCPMEVPGTQVATVDTPDGASVTFTTSPDRAAELRSRVRAMAQMHDTHDQDREGMRGGEHHRAMHLGEENPDTMNGPAGTGSAADQGMPMMPPPSRATVEDVEGGARMVVTPNDPADLDRLRSALRTQTQRMQQTGQCGHGGR